MIQYSNRMPVPPEDWLSDTPPETGSDGAAANGAAGDGATSPKQGTVIFIGGYGDGRNIGDDGIVSRYADTFRNAHDNLDVQYFPWDQADKIRNYAASLSPGTDVSIVGHSYGADTGAQVAQSLGRQNIPVNTLVTIDPVGHGWTDGFMSNVANNSARWVNVQAQPPSWNRSDWVAFGGSRVGSDVSPYVDDFIVSPGHHEDFWPMMDTSFSGKQSPKDIVVSGIPAP